MQYFYHSSLSNYTIALLDLFNDIHVPRYNNSGERIEDIKIPIQFGNKDMAYNLENYSQENISNGNVYTLPKMVLGFESMSKDLERGTNKHNPINKRDTIKNNKVLKYFQKSPVPYIFTFNIYLVTKSFTDTTIVIEQIAAMFNPSVYIKVNEIDIQEEPTSIIVDIQDFSIDIPETNTEDIRIISTEIPVSIRGNLYPRIEESGIIEEIDIAIQSIEKERTIKNGEYYIEDIISTDSTVHEGK